MSASASGSAPALPPGAVRSESHARSVARTVAIVVLAALALYLVYLLRQPLGWIVVAAFIAVALSGPVNLLHRRMPRGLAIALAYLGLVLVPVGIGAIVVPPLVREVTKLADNAPRYVSDAQKAITKNRTLRKLDNEYHIGAKLQQKAKELPGHIGDAAGLLSDVGGTIVSSLFAAFNILILSVFMVASGRRWIDRLIGLQRPEHAPRIERALDRIANAIGNYVGGALVQAAIAGVTTFVVLTILSVPFAAPLAVIVAIFDLIPLVGATIAAVLVGIVTLFNDFPLVTIIWTVWSIVYQQVENTVIQPQIQKRAVEVHAFVVLVSVLCGATLFGILGALLAIPFAASAQIALREWWDYRTASAVELPSGIEPQPPGRGPAAA